jgi:hypothetical protein
MSLAIHVNCFPSKTAFTPLIGERKQQHARKNL